MPEKLNIDVLKSHITSPQRTYLWEFEIPSPRGAGDAEIWNIRALSVTIPTRELENIDIDYKGTGGFRIPGRERYTHEFPVTILEGEDAKGFKAIHSWMQLIRNNITGLGESDPDIKTDAIITLLSTKGEPTLRIKLVGVYPRIKPEQPLVSNESREMQHEVIFCFDRFEEMS